jgi:hypothetical protein
MRGIMRLAVAAVAAVACSCGDGNTNPGSAISVGGTYQTAVTLVQNDCPGQTVEQHETVVSHDRGNTRLSLTHAGSTYDGFLAADGSFTTRTVTQVFGGVSYSISISGQFTVTDMDGQVHVEAGRQPPCSFTARWAGPKDGDPNVIP